MMITATSFLVTLAAIGFGVSFYLLHERMGKRVPVCFIGADCGKVLESAYNKTFGVYNDVLGVVYYSGQLALALILILGLLPIPERILTDFILVGSLTGSIFSAYFTYIQARVIKAWCSWCLTSAAITWLMLLISLTNRLR